MLKGKKLNVKNLKIKLFTIQRLLKIFCVVLLIQPNISYANCANLLRLEVNKRMNVESYLFSIDHLKLTQKKVIDLQKELSCYPKTKNHIDVETVQATRKFQEMLNNSSLELSILEVLKSYKTNINDKSFLLKWVQDLYMDIVVEIYLKGELQDQKRFEITDEIDEKYIIDVILERSKEGGFSGRTSSIRTLEKEVDDDEFKKILFRKEYIYDKGFKLVNHGHLIHLFHIDFMIYSLKHSSLNPQRASEVYAWFGRKNLYLSHSGFDFKPIDAWFILFDSYEGDFTSPEILNQILNNFFNWIS